jgi:hypothetical protein
MPLVFIHGVATRRGRHYDADVAFRDAFFKKNALKEVSDAEALPQRGLRLVATPRGAWRQFFQSLVLAGDGGLPREYHCGTSG